MPTGLLPAGTGGPVCQLHPVRVASVPPRHRIGARIVAFAISAASPNGGRNFIAGPLPSAGISGYAFVSYGS